MCPDASGNQHSRKEILNDGSELCVCVFFYFRLFVFTFL